MISGNNIKKNIIILLTLAVVLCGAGWLSLNIYQSPEKTDEIYSNALKSYNNKDFSNAYYQFSKIVFTSNLKPLAIYHQAVAAESLDDTKSAIKQYKFFSLLYPKHVLSIKVKYNLARNLMKNDSNSAKKYFEEIIFKYPHSDYAIASEYYSGLLDLNKYEKEKIFPLSVKNEIQNHFRHYLKKAPSGRLALQVISDWERIGVTISKDDYLLMAKSCLLLEDYKRAADYAKKADYKNSWAIDAKTAFATGNNSRVQFLVEWGLNGNADYVENEDLYSAIDSYMATVPSKYSASVKLLGIAKNKGKDYITSIKCKYSPNDTKFDCYKNMNIWYRSSNFLDEAQAYMFLSMVNNNNIQDAQRIGIDFLNKYKDTSPYAPMVMYYMGRVSENARAYRDYISYYRGVISKYPDSYYAYRSYLRLNHNNSTIISRSIREKSIEFPYQRPHAFLEKLLKLKDYEMLDEYTAYDDFLKSWAMYEKGNKTQAMVVARDAMDKLKEKPERNDLRWRLVYPVFYYEDIKDAADKAGTVAPLMLALTREESYFNPNAKSSVGATGLMQLMPFTAKDIASRKGISSYSLYNPTQNILLGNYYYGFIKGQLNGQDIQAIAAYNGGVGAVNQWKSSLEYHDMDSFVEQIPYPETQTYVKKVLRSYWNYIRLYGENS